MAVAEGKTEVNGIVDSQILPLNISAWQSSLAQAVNSTYTYTCSSLFCAVVAGYYKDYAYRYIRVACQWLDGYVPTIHYPQSGIISTRIASSLINGLARTITGEKLVYKIRGDKTPESMKTLEFVSEWGDTNNIKKAVKNAIAYSLALGTSLLKLNRRSIDDEKRKIWWEAVRFDNCFYLADASNEVYDAEFLLRSYTDTRADATTTQFYLSEHRFYKYFNGSVRQNENGTYSVVHKKGDKVAMVEYRVHRAKGQSLNNTMATTSNRSSIGWSEIPEEIRKLIKRDYSVIRINEPQELGLPNLGVEVLVNDEGDISIPTGSNFGRGLIVPVIDDFVIYEVAESYAIRDMYNGKGTVYVPKSLNIGDTSIPIPTKFNMDIPSDDGAIKFDGSSIKNKELGIAPQYYKSPLTGLDDKYEQIPGVNPEDQTIVVQQFDLRPNEWEMIQENCLKRIAVKWGMSPKILSSFLAQGAVQMTATQIDSEDDISIAFINQERATFKPVFNRLLETTLNFYGRPHNVDIEFASPSLINKDRILERVAKKLELGLIDIEEAIREINPDLDEQTLQARIDAAKAEQQRQMLMQMSEMNEYGEFSPNNEGDLGGANLKGSTAPIQ